MMIMPRLAVAVLIISALFACGEQSTSQNALPEGITPEMLPEGITPQMLPEDITPEMLERHKRIMGHRKPPASLVDVVEAQVARDPCVKDLGQWERIYSFGLNDKREVDETKVLFDYRQAGVHGFQSGRRVMAPGEWMMPDDRDYDLVIGSFDRTSGKLIIEACGSNLPDAA